ncbi:MAG TPA: CYTH domain-containing protein [Pseudonocardiaceae bacterium]|nr:CYTH domain-containing protein [Pseudonocardiaceae bacterium]
MSTRVTEVERKYEANDSASAFDPSTLAQLTGTSGRRRTHDHRLTAVYYDTEDLALLGSGMTLRRREGGEDPGWHLKVPTGKDTRIETRLPLDDSAGDVPAELRSLVRATVRHANLVAVARIDTDRTLHRWTDETGAPIIDVMVDRVSANDLRSRGAMRHRTEVEVELGSGGHELLAKIESRLTVVGLRRSITSTKLAKALDWTAPSTTAARRAGSTGRQTRPVASTGCQRNQSTIDYSSACDH